MSKVLVNLKKIIIIFTSSQKLGKINKNRHFTPISLIRELFENFAG